jgi:hypothetical protein
MHVGRSEALRRLQEAGGRHVESGWEIRFSVSERKRERDLEREREFEREFERELEHSTHRFR